MSKIALKIKEINALLENKFPHAHLVVVTKSRTKDETLEALLAGAGLIGENRIQEAKDKFEQLTGEPAFMAAEKHFIGHLQSNKAKEAVALFDMIQSVDSVHLAIKISEEAAKIDKVMPILLQVNISQDANKSGFLQSEIFAAYEQVAKLGHVAIKGLMTITKEYDDVTLTKRDFSAMKTLFDEFCDFTSIPAPILSMGMSNDYSLALECGSNMIRVGSYIFA